jgi:hypothetical protein
MHQSMPAQTQRVSLAALFGALLLNDVLNAQGNTQAALWNRIPAPAWILMGLIAIFANLPPGYRGRVR